MMNFARTLAVCLITICPASAHADAGSWKSAPASQPQGAISPSQASSFIGRYATVAGEVSQVSHDSRSGVTFINLGGAYPNHAFTAVIFPDSLSNFREVEALQGRSASFSGVIKIYKGKPQIILRDMSQVGLD